MMNQRKKLKHHGCLDYSVSHATPISITTAIENVILQIKVCDNNKKISHAHINIKYLEPIQYNANSDLECVA